MAFILWYTLAERIYPSGYKHLYISVEPKSRKKTPVQKALIEMRRRLQLTQQQLAIALKVGLPTVGRWESTRSPTGSSLLQLARFAHDAGEHESYLVFLKAAMQARASKVPVIRMSADAPMPVHSELLFPRAAEKALPLIRAGGRRNPAIAREYLKLLRGILTALEMCGDEAIQAHRRGEDFLSRWVETECDLRKEVADEEKKTEEG
jgi:transcriptional regulator with XRE-family HTH domain